ncbi:MAG: hypothetical protein IT476_05470, partial [Rhodanobacteraceae bacterium]|nr:hypothetical protein [Rhodanobacteraceae bacterium]
MNRRFFRTGLGVALLAAGFGHCASASEGAWLRIESSRADLSRITALPGETIDYGRFQWIAAAAVNEAALH